MTVRPRIIGELRRNDSAQRMRIAHIGRYLTRLGDRHLHAGLPQLAVFAFDHIGQAVALWGRYERDELTLLANAVKPHLVNGGVCLDVGANIGNHAVFFAGHFDEVIAFEPNPRTFRLLQINAELCPNIQCINVGLSDQSGIAILSVPAGNIGMATLHQSANHLEQTVEVECKLRRMDDLPDIAGRRVALIKIDVEGHELAVLQGACQTLLRDRPIVVFEQTATEIKDGRSVTIDYLRDSGYRTFWTITRSPDTGLRLADLFRRLLWGESLQMVECRHFESRFHSMIVALPSTS
jgi:FkbM family methyltransferase